MYNNIVPPSAAVALLRKACARNLPLEVIPPGGEAAEPLKSRFLQHSGAGKASAILIEAPTASGRPVALHPGDQIQILALMENERYGFYASVRDRSSAKLMGQMRVAAVSLDMPEVVVKLQRRRFYRAGTPRMAPVMVDCTARKPKTAKGQESELIRFQAAAADISVGGIGLRVPKRFAGLAKSKKRWVLSFSLPEYAAPITLAAEIRHTKKVRGKANVLLGAQFVNWERTLAGRQAVNALSRYVARRQREELKKLSGLA